MASFEARERMDDGVGERVKEARLAKGMSQAELATAIGVSNSYLSHIEAGRRPVSAALRLQIATVLGLEPKQLDEGVPSDRKQELQLKLGFAEMALRNGNWEVAEKEFADALQAARTLPFQRFADEAAWGLARASEAMGDLEGAIDGYEVLLRQAKLSPGVGRISVATALVRAYNECGDLSRAIDVGEQVRAEWGEAPETDPGALVELISTLTGCYVERGDLTRAKMLIQEALEAAGKANSLRAKAAAAWEAAVVADTRHDGHAAQHYAERALALYQELDSRRGVGLLHVVVAGLLLRQETPEPVRAASLLSQALAELSETGTELDLAYVRTEQARAELLSGRAAEAARTVESALGAMPAGNRLQRGRLLVLQGHAARAEGRADEALASFASAAEYLRQAGATRQAASAWRELGEAYAELGRPADAIEALRLANDLAGIRHSPSSLGAAVGQPVSQ